MIKIMQTPTVRYTFEKPKASGIRTPWGKSQSITEIAPGIRSVSTASHGGIKISTKLNKLIPNYMRNANGWYEEDCEWAFPFVVFEKVILENGEVYSVKYIQDKTHTATLRNWFPDAYEQFFNVSLVEGESSKRDEQLWKQRHANDLQTVSAFGDWHKNVPEGFVGVVACVGGRTEMGQYAGAERYFLVPDLDYSKKRAGVSFIVDPAKHEEIARFF